MHVHTGTGAASSERVLSFLQHCAGRIRELAPAPPAAVGARAFVDALRNARPIEVTPRWLPVLDTIGELEATPLGHRFGEVARLLAWQPTFRTDDGGTRIALAPMEHVVDLGGLTVGLLYVAAGRTYPLHSHPPHELYLTISGTARWRYGGSTEYRSVEAGCVIHNHPNDLHATVAGGTPLVALYVLWDEPTATHTAAQP
jgi:quercetin dioxygenase-like cupin family protein